MASVFSTRWKPLTRAATSTADAAAGSKLAWVELGRGLAAFVVMLLHASTGMIPPQYSGHVFGNGWFSLGFLGVDFFFVLSGFIILYVHYNDIGRPDRLARYGWRRVTRIFPTYWVIFLVALALNLALQNDKADPDAAWLAQQLTLAPGADTWLGPAWTLRFELTFYLLFCTLLINRWLGIAILASWFGLAAWVSIPIGQFEESRYLNEFWHILTSPYNFNFVFGMALAFALRKGKGLSALTLGFAALGLTYAAWAMQNGIDWHGLIRFPGWGVICAALLGGLLHLDRLSLPIPRVFLWLGSISYSLYLSHTIFMGYFMATLARLGIYPLFPEWMVYCGQIAVALLCATAINRWLERPLLAWAQAKVN